MVLQYCGGINGLPGGGCAGNAAAVTPQPFFEAALTSCPPGIATGLRAALRLLSTMKELAYSMRETPMPPEISPSLKSGACGAIWTVGLQLSAQHDEHNHWPFRHPAWTSGVGINSSIGFGNYNAGFVSVKMADWRGLTMQSNFTWSRALGTAARFRPPANSRRTILSTPRLCTANRFSTANSSTTRSLCTSHPSIRAAGTHGTRAGRMDVLVYLHGRQRLSDRRC